MPQALEDALRLHEQGRLADAERLYRDALEASPRDYDALHMLGILKLQQGRAEDAAPLIAAALEVDGRSVAALANYGIALSALRRHEEALASYDKALAIEPRNAGTLASRGDTLCDLGKRDEALASYDAALAIDPRFVSALVNRGVVLRDLGRPADALASYDRALAIEGNDAEAWNNRGVALRELSRDAEALASYDRALALRPDYPDALFNRGSALLLLKRPAEALTAFGRVLALRPELAEVHVSRGHALYDLAQRAEALASYDKALALAPDRCDGLLGRARVLRDLNRYEEALADYERAFAIDPEFPHVLNDLADCRTAACQWTASGTTESGLVARAVRGDAIIDPFLLLRLDSSPEQQLACARHWLRQKRAVGVARQWNRADFTGDKIRIAYLSADYHRHATAYLISELFELHDRKRFEIIGVSFGPDDGSAERARLTRSFDRFFDVTSRPTAEAARLIRDLKVHVAVDLKGHTIDARIGLLADRAAPVQASYLGYPGTTGADFIDYVIADAVVLPFAQQMFYPEKIVHLPDSYQVNDRKRPIAAPVPTRREAGLPDDGFVFCCFNNTWKLNARVFDIWMRLLAAVPGSVLWLYQSNSLAGVNLRREAAARGIDPARLVFAPHCDLAGHLARLKLADLFLDTLPYNAHTTASDALWVGVPIVTCRGDTFAGRVAASLLQAVGLPELATATLDDYERLALRLATGRDELQSLRDRLAASGRSAPLFDADRFRRHIEAAYATMWDIWCRGESPRGFRIDPIER